MAKRKVTAAAKQKQFEKQLASLGKQKLKLLEKIASKRQELNDHLRKQHIQDRYGPEMASLVAKMGPEEANKLLKETQKSLKEQKVVMPRIVTGVKGKPVGTK